MIAETIERPRDCTHPHFPLRKRCRTHRGKPYAEWVKKIRKVRISFGSVSKDPTGVWAWQCYEIERAAWEVRENPREGLRRGSIAKAFGHWWLLAGPLAQDGIACIEPRRDTLMCLNCFTTWTAREPGTDIIPQRLLRCPRDCRSNPLANVKKTLRLTTRQQDIDAGARAALRRAKASGWHSNPLDVDAAAEAEGMALLRFALHYAAKGPRGRNYRPLTYTRNDIIRAVARHRPQPLC